MKAIFALIVVCLLIVGLGYGCVAVNKAVGVGGWGPTAVHECTVNRLYVDYSGTGEDRSSHYMVGTTDGVFECDNGIMLGVWNADELYSKLQQGKKFRITTKGKQRVGWFMQEYPYVVAVEPIN